LREHDCQSLVDHICLIEAELNKIGDATGAPRIKSIFDSVPTLETRYYVEDQSGNKTFAVSDSVFDNCVEFDCVLRLKPHETRLVQFITGDGPKRLEVTRLE
jgi:hypothetical protein